MLALPVVAALFLAGFVANVVTGDVTLGDSLIQWAIVAFATTTYLFGRREARLRADLVQFLRQHARDVQSGTATYHGVPVTYATRLCTYHVVMSFLLVTIRLPSRLVIEGGA